MSSECQHWVEINRELGKCILSNEHKCPHKSIFLGLTVGKFISEEESAVDSIKNMYHKYSKVILTWE